MHTVVEEEAAAVEEEYWADIDYMVGVEEEAVVAEEMAFQSEATVAEQVASWVECCRQRLQIAYLA